jgi:ribosome-binding protein aMBF1 (putative translation factor)
MLTKKLGQAYDNMPEESKSALLALSVLMDRIRSLPRQDRDDLFELLTELREDADNEERKSIRIAMEEILAQIPVEMRSVSMAPSGNLSEKRKKWADHVGKKIKELREAAGLTQVKLAEKAGLPQSHISRIENAEYSPTNITIAKIAKALNVVVGVIDPCID